MRFYIIALWTSLGPKILGEQNGYDSPVDASIAIIALREAKAKHSDGLLNIMQLL